MPRLYDATFSIAGVDIDQGEVGVSIATKRPAVGNRCISAMAGIGAVASQATTNPYIPQQALDLMSLGRTPEECFRVLESQDTDIQSRQVNIVSVTGASLSFTGAKCQQHASGKHGYCYATAGNILAGPEVVEAVAFSFEHSEGPLARRLVSAILAGEAEEGDKRGKQSAAVLVAKVGWHPFVDLRVDDSEDPARRLSQLLDLWFEQMKTQGPLPDLQFRTLETGMIGLDVADVSNLMRSLGYYGGPVTSRFTADLRTAIESYQRDNGLSVNGLLDGRTLDSLRTKGGD